MPVNPSPELMQHLFGAPPQQNPVGLPGINGPMPVAQSTLPSWMRQGFEGGVDAAQGMLGFGGGPNTTRMNKVGQLGMAALPVIGGLGAARFGLGGEIPQAGGLPQTISGPSQSRLIGGLKGLGQMDGPISPNPGEIESLVAQLASRMKGVPPPAFPDGRFGGHLAPNLGPMDFPVQNRVAMFGNPGVMDEMGRNVAPPQAPQIQPDHLEQLMSKYRR